MAGVAGHHADLVGPKMSHSAKNFSETRPPVSRGSGVEAAHALGQRGEVRAGGHQALPEPVGVLRMTFAPDTISISASSCAGYRVMPCPVVHSVKAQ